MSADASKNVVDSVENRDVADTSPNIESEATDVDYVQKVDQEKYVEAVVTEKVDESSWIPRNDTKAIVMLKDSECGDMDLCSEDGALQELATEIRSLWAPSYTNSVNSSTKAAVQEGRTNYEPG